MSKEKNKVGLNRFEHYLVSTEALMAKAAVEKDPGQWLFENGFRTTLFMLEALSKLYANIHNRKKFTKLRERFKLLEDIIGGADYYACFAKELAANKAIPATAAAWLQQKANEEITALNRILSDKGWLDGKRIPKIREDLNDADWKSEKDETEAICKIYRNDIGKIVQFVTDVNFRFDNVEEDVHELRRKLRWLSIYPQALQGTVQLSQTKKPADYLKKYLTPEIVNSPFNKMPEAGACSYFVMLDKNYFYALSWMISELGKLKDSGLRILALTEALQETEKMNEQTALKKACSLLGKDQPGIGQLLKQAEKITKTFFKEKDLESLVVGTASIKG